MLFVLNWKMRLDHKEAIALAQGYKKEILPKTNGHKIIIFPSFTDIPALVEIFEGTGIEVGAQDCSFFQGKLPITGEISAELLHSARAKYVLAGHFDRRDKLHENNALINQKMQNIISSGLTPMLNIGENAEEHAEKQTLGVLENQLQICLKDIASLKELIVIYEPGWRISSNLNQSEKMNTNPDHSDLPGIAKFIRDTAKGILPEVTRVTKLSELPELPEPPELPELPRSPESAGLQLLYGGSVNAGNIKELSKLNIFDGFAIGSASLEIQSMIDLVEQIGQSNKM